ncbi:MAG TPA: response regulator [Burkholderiales bacterium]|nr:response regulator [Burkholderiales bacterium]
MPIHPSARPIVYIVDDDAAVRDSLDVLLRVRGHATRSYSSGSDFLSEVDRNARGCVLLDLRMPGLDGLAIQSMLSSRDITLPVIMLTAHGDVATTRAAMKAGAFDFLEKPFDDDVLRSTIDAALARDTEARAETDRRTELSRLVDRLSARERQVLACVVAGRHNREIAVELGISPRTVEVYKARVMEKLRVERLPDLIRIALELDLA